MTEQQLLMFTSPMMAFFIALEIVLSWYFNRPTYNTKDTAINLTCTALNGGLDLLTRGFTFAILVFCSQYSFFHFTEKSYFYWISLFIIHDLLYYLLHLTDHYSRFFWAVHVTHHSSQKFNLSVAIRSSVFQPLYRFVFYIPLMFLGYDPLDLAFIFAVSQTYGFFVHTESVGKLGFLEWFMVTPSHHRVHHASNVRYLDKNMGMVLIIWDKIFGTFAEETEKPRYGLTSNQESYNPINIVFYEWRNIWHDLKEKKATFWQKMMYVFGPPGWSHDGSTLTSSQLRAQEAATENATKQ
ncbi:sterol desaturase family protein [Flexibacter flexilis]|nr:sterol desaturase family protein [Flexibacter flexilis]